MKIKREKILSIWFLLLIASFAYEKPIWILSSMDRLNPRLFDIITLMGIFILPLTKKTTLKNSIYSKYKKLLIWLGICSIFSISFYSFPSEINNYTVYFYLKYLQELLILFIAMRVLSKGININSLFKVFILSGLFVFGYSIYELFYGVVGQIEYAPGKFMIKPPGVIWGPFGKTYFQIANYLPLVSLLTFAYATSFKGIKKISLYVFSILMACPLLFTGSRTGIGLLILSFIIFTVFRYKFHYSIAVLSITGILISGFFLTQKSNDFQTLQRIGDMENHEANSVASRILLFEDFEITSYVHNGILLPFFGGGFYVAPTYENFRIGYGFHNIYLFALEQAGVIGLILFISFLRIAYRNLKAKLTSFSNNKKSLEYVLISGVLGYFLASLLIGFAGHTFWRGFATNNFNTLRIILLLVVVAIPEIQKYQDEKNTIS